MGTVQIKFCGINDAKAMDAAVAAQADYAGLVFYPPSPRAVSAQQAASLADQSVGRLTRVGLFVDASDAEIAEAFSAARLGALQLHGGETPQRASELRSRFGVPVWKAISVSGVADVRRADLYAGAADLVLFDAKTPKGTLPGGMGLSFDWSLVANWKGPMAWGLAGGINPVNVAEAVAITGAPLVDVSSGVESAPGQKDPARMSAFAKAVRGG